MNDSPDKPAVKVYSKICSPGHLRGRRTSATVAKLIWENYYAQCPLCPEATAFEVSGEGIATFEVSGPACEVQGLHIERGYRLAVRAKAANLVSEPSYITIPRVGKGPTEPRNLRITANANRTVSIAWDSPLDHSPVGYDVILLGKVRAVTEPYETLNNMVPGLLLYIGVRTRLPNGDESVIIYIPVIPKR